MLKACTRLLTKERTVTSLDVPKSKQVTFATIISDKRDIKVGKTEPKIRNILKIEVKGDSALGTLKKAYNPGRVGVKILDCWETRKGSILMEVKDKEDANKFKCDFNDREELKHQFKLVETRKGDPRLVVFDVPEDIGEEEIQATLTGEGHEGRRKIVTRFRSRRGMNWVVEVDPKTFKEALKKGKF